MSLPVRTPGSRPHWRLPPKPQIHYHSPTGWHWTEKPWNQEFYFCPDLLLPIHFQLYIFRIRCYRSRCGGYRHAGNRFRKKIRNNAFILNAGPIRRIVRIFSIFAGRTLRCCRDTDDRIQISVFLIPAGFLPCRPRLLCMQMHAGTRFVLCGPCDQSITGIYCLTRQEGFSTNEREKHDSDRR